MKVVIGNLLNMLNSMPLRAQKEVARVGVDLVDQFRKTAPWGIQEALKQSSKYKLDQTQTNEGVLLQITSQVPYALRVNYELQLHVPQSKLGKHSFLLEGRKHPSSIGIKRRKRSMDEYNYYRGLRLAHQGKVPAERYDTQYIQTSIDNLGGVEGIRDRIQKALF